MDISVTEAFSYSNSRMFKPTEVHTCVLSKVCTSAEMKLSNFSFCTSICSVHFQCQILTAVICSHLLLFELIILTNKMELPVFPTVTGVLVLRSRINFFFTSECGIVSIGIFFPQYPTFLSPAI